MCSSSLLVALQDCRKLFFDIFLAVRCRAAPRQFEPKSCLSRAALFFGSPLPPVCRVDFDCLSGDGIHPGAAKNTATRKCERMGAVEIDDCQFQVPIKGCSLDVKPASHRGNASLLRPARRSGAIVGITRPRAPALQQLRTFNIAAREGGRALGSMATDPVLQLS